MARKANGTSIPTLIFPALVREGPDARLESVTVAVGWIDIKVLPLDSVVVGLV